MNNSNSVTPNRRQVKYTKSTTERLSIKNYASNNVTPVGAKQATGEGHFQNVTLVNDPKAGYRSHERSSNALQQRRSNIPSQSLIDDKLQDSSQGRFKPSKAIPVLDTSCIEMAASGLTIGNLLSDSTKQDSNPLNSNESGDKPARLAGESLISNANLFGQAHTIDHVAKIGKSSSIGLEQGFTREFG